ncbi:MAG: DUF1080 domain-containing protein [Omnitrophica bacterium]|nr:DUF1080 domain-containing protein [Candidatus Omnitrophota bacterium]
MKKIAVSLCFFVTMTAALFAVAGQGLIWNFDESNVGRVPPGWKDEATNPRGENVTWEVITDYREGRQTKVLGMTNANGASGSTYNICWTDTIAFKDGEIEVSFKAMSGKEDQGGGPIWRVRDANNYYIARFNPLEDNFRLYYVKDGARRQLDSKNIRLSPGAWHTIKIVHKDSRIKAYLNGKKLLEYNDNTFFEAGGVGVWTKADASTYFDDLRIISE